jgi:hypothetical protein
MASLTLQSSRSLGRALVVGNPACRQAVLQVLSQEGQTAFETECPYQAMAELARKSQAYRMVILSLQSLYREELVIVAAIKSRHPDLDVWLAQTEGRAGALTDALQLGADGIVAGDGLHRLAAAGATIPAPAVPSCPDEPVREITLPPEEPVLSVTPSDPVLTADELRALLQEPPA